MWKHFTVSAFDLIPPLPLPPFPPSPFPPFSFVQLMCCFLMRTTNAIEHGAKSEWLCRGMMSAKFLPMSHKLAAAEHVFDVISVMQTLQK